MVLCIDLQPAHVHLLRLLTAFVTASPAVGAAVGAAVRGVGWGRWWGRGWGWRWGRRCWELESKPIEHPRQLQLLLAAGAATVLIAG